jgi:hypothetical protein
MAILARLRKVWEGAGDVAFAVGFLLALVVVVPGTYIYGLWRGRKEGKVIEGAKKDIERVREAEAAGDAEWLARDIEKRLRGDK